MKTLIHFFTLLLCFLLACLSIRAADTTETIEAGRKLTLTATSDANPPATYEWYRNGVKIGDGATLTIESLAATNAGTYTVKASNIAGSATSVGWVLVVDDRTPPVFALAPLDATPREGEVFTLSAVATGKPAPTYQWLKNGQPVAGATKDKLVFSPVMRADSGIYSVIANNEKGSVTSATATINVLYAPSAPVIKSALSNVTVIQKQTVSLGVVAVGDDLSFQWKKGVSNLRGKTDPFLTLRNVTPADAGTYAVTVSNPHGSVTSSAKVSVVK